MRKAIYITLAICLLTLISMNSRAADLSDVQIGGYVSQGYFQTDQNNYLADNKRGSFEFNEMGINFQTHPADKMMVGVQFSARDLGEVGNDEINIGWAFGEYSWREWLGVRAGIIKTPQGLYNDTRDYDVLRSSIFLPSSLYNEWLRDATDNVKGVQLFGNIDMKKAGLLKYQLQAGGTQIPLDSGTALYIRELSSGVSSVDNIDLGKLYNSHIIWLSPLDGLRFGYTLSYYDKLSMQFTLFNGASMMTNATDSYTQIYSIEYTFRDLVIAGEYYTVKRDQEQIIPALALVSSLKHESGPTYHVSASYRFTDWFQLGAYYSSLEDDKDVDAETNELDDICLSLRFDINESWIAKCEVHMMDGLFGVFPEDDGTIDKDWMLYAAKLSYSF